MRITVSIFIAIFVTVVSRSFAEPVVLETEHLRLAIAETGHVVEFVDKRDGVNHVDPPRDARFCILRPKKEGPYLGSNRIEHDGDTLTVSFVDSPVRAKIRYKTDKDRVVFDLLEVTGGDFYSLQFARIPVKIGYPHEIGENFAATAMSRKINTRTLDYPGRSRLLGGQIFSGLGFDGAGVTLLAMPENNLRNTMKTVVDSYPVGTMPVSKAGGPYALDHAKNYGNYIITSTPIKSEEVDDWAGHLARFGVDQVDFHQGTPFRQGDFEFNKTAYPNGIADFRKTSEAFEKHGMITGLHTYAQFLSPLSRFVTPVPHRDLDVLRSFTLAADLTTEATTIAVSESTADVSEVTGFFVRNSKILRVGDELIRFGKPAKEAPFGFTECERGVYGTKISEHESGTPVEHMTHMFFLFVPKPGSELALEVARETARAYNEGGFGMIYLDALDGTHSIVHDKEHAWYYDALFVNELLKHCESPPLLEYSTFSPLLWYGRSRMGAWDAGHRAYQRFFDMHVDANLSTADRLYLPGQFGWLALCPSRGDDLDNFQYNILFSEDVQYLGAKILGHNYGLSYLDIPKGTTSPFADKNGAILKEFDTLRRSGRLSKATRERLRDRGKQFLLRENDNGRYFLEAEYGRAVLGLYRDTMEFDNPFDAGRPMLRIESRHLPVDYDSPDVVELLAIDETKPAEALISKTFAEPVDLSKHLGLGLWVLGDRGGQQINLRLASPPHLVSGFTDHYIDVDFEGWRYFPLAEAENGSRHTVKWPLPAASMYVEYRQKVHFKSVSEIHLAVVGDPKNLRFRSVKALPIPEDFAVDPTIEINGTKITFRGKLRNGHFMECEPGGRAVVYDASGAEVGEMPPSETLPELPKGRSTIRFSGKNASGRDSVIRLTVRSDGNRFE